MNIIKKIVKETVLLPYRVVQGLGAAMDEVTEVDTKKEKPSGKRNPDRPG